MLSLSYEDIQEIEKGNYEAYHRVIRHVKDIIYSKLSGYSDIKTYIDDLTSNAMIVLMRSVKNYNTKKSKFSSYAFNRIVSSSRKCYLSLKYPYSGIKALSGKKKVDLDSFRNSALAYIMYNQDLCIEVSANSIDDIESYIGSLLNVKEERRLLPKILSLAQGKIAPSDMKRHEFLEILNILKERMSS